MTNKEILKKLNQIRNALVAALDVGSIYSTAVRDCDELLREFEKRREVPE